MVFQKEESILSEYRIYSFVSNSKSVQQNLLPNLAFTPFMALFG